MAKVLISHIGTGRVIGSEKKENSAREYVGAKYKFEGIEEPIETTFFTAALSEHLKVDKMILIGTAKSMWEEVYNYFTEKTGDTLDEEYWIDIVTKASASNYNKSFIDSSMLKKTMEAVDNYLRIINPEKRGKSIALIIKYGLNEEELWENFGTIMQIMSILKDKDEIYIDITHSFRSIPLFIYLLMDFIRTLKLKDIKVKGVYYGMLEANIEMGNAPVVDLSPLLTISEWILGTHDFINYGNGYLISELSAENSELSKRLKNISNLININYLVDLQKQIVGLSKIIDKDTNIEALKYIIPMIKSFSKRFVNIKNASEFQLELSKWYFDNKRYGHGYICLIESVLTKICEVYKLDITDIDIRKKVLGFMLNNYRKSDELKELYYNYKSINKIRNKIAHASFFHMENSSFTNDINLAGKYYSDIKRLLESKKINELSEILKI